MIPDAFSWAVVVSKPDAPASSIAHAGCFILQEISAVISLRHAEDFFPRSQEESFAHKALSCGLEPELIVSGGGRLFVKAGVGLNADALVVSDRPGDALLCCASVDVMG